MQKFFHKIRAVMIVIGLLLVVAASSLSVSAQSLEVYVGGMPAGFTMGLGGAQIVGVCEILTEEGVSCPAKEAQLNVGDIILTYGGVRIDSAADIDRALSANGGKDAEICVRRDEEQFSKKITPVKDLSCGKYKLGVLIREFRGSVRSHISKKDRVASALSAMRFPTREGKSLPCKRARSTRAASSTSFAESGAEREN